MSEEYYWDIANATIIGQYITKKEQKLIDLAVGDNNALIKSCLDIGAGSGRFSIPLYEKGFDVIALEYDLISLRKLREKNRAIPLVHAEAHYLPFENSTFDCILAIEVAEEAGKGISSLPTFLNECYRILKNDGILLTTMSNKNSYKRVIRSLIRKENKIGFYQLSYESHLEELRKCGFTIEKTWGFNWIPSVRNSNNKFIPLCSFIEKLFRLELIPSVSPWIFIVSKKKFNPQ